MEWYKNVWENTFGLNQQSPEEKSSVQRESGVNTASPSNEDIDSTSLGDVPPALSLCSQVDKEWQRHAYNSSGLLDSLQSFFGNSNDDHPTYPIEDERHCNDARFVIVEAEFQEPRVVPRSEDLEDFSFHCDSVVDDDDDDDSFAEHRETKPKALHAMEEGISKPTVISKELFEELAAKNERHFRLFGHGKFWTCLSLCFAWCGVVCAVQSARSVHFVRLQKPILITPMYYPVERMGLLRTEICLNTTAAGVSGCEIISIDSEDIDDKKFGLARLFLMLGTAFGVFFTLLLSTSVYWESINLRPLAFGFLGSYFFQSLSMLFFDTDICASNKCRVDQGCFLSICAALGWIATCIASSKMDSFKVLAKRQRRRELRERLRDEYQKERKKFVREPSTATETTDVSQQTYSTSSSIDLSMEVDEISDLWEAMEKAKRSHIKEHAVTRLDPSLTVVKVLGIHTEGMAFNEKEDLHEC